jgi:hypothetical protein
MSRSQLGSRYRSPRSLNGGTAARRALGEIRRASAKRMTTKAYMRTNAPHEFNPRGETTIRRWEGLFAVASKAP